MFTAFQRWCLALPVPALRLPAITAPSEDDLVRRSFEISFDLCAQTDRDICQNMIELGGLKYLEEEKV